jgi:hypothetical protein
MITAMNHATKPITGLAILHAISRLRKGAFLAC